MTRKRPRAATSGPGCGAPRPGLPRTSRRSSARTGRPAYRAAYLVVHDAAAAEDIAQEAFLAARARARPLRPPPPVRPVAAPDRRQPRDRLGARPRAAPRGRAGRRRRPPSRRSADRTSSLRELATLSPEHRAVIVLRYLLDYTPGEIAELLDLPRGTVNSRLRRGLDALKERCSELRAPNENEAGERGWAVVRAAYESQREPVAWPRRHVRPLVAGALVAAVVAAALSPPGRSVVHSLREAVGVKHGASRSSSRCRRPGELLVTQPQGPWLVRDDGSRGCSATTATRPSPRTASSSRPPERTSSSRSTRRATSAGRSPGRPRASRPGPGRARTRGSPTSRAGSCASSRATGPATTPSAAPHPSRRRGSPVEAACSRTRTDEARWSTTSTRDHVLRTLPNVPTKLAWSDDGSVALVLAAPHARLPGSKVVAADDPSDATFDRAPPSSRNAEVAAVRPAGEGSNVFSLMTGRTLFRGTGVFGQVACVAGRPLAARHVADREPVGVCPTAGLAVSSGVSRISAQFEGFPRVVGWCCAR